MPERRSASVNGLSRLRVDGEFEVPCRPTDAPQASTPPHGPPHTAYRRARARDGRLVGPGCPEPVWGPPDTTVACDVASYSRAADRRHATGCVWGGVRGGAACGAACGAAAHEIHLQCTLTRSATRRMHPTRPSHPGVTHIVTHGQVEALRAFVTDRMNDAGVASPMAELYAHLRKGSHATREQTLSPTALMPASRVALRAAAGHGPWLGGRGGTDNFCLSLALEILYQQVRGLACTARIRPYAHAAVLAPERLASRWTS